ncbi:MAG: DUF4115 domain-containing protein [Candidatus Omnitrophica bacterium]|nr:DUF4115 domain-containing protein [Candidatus Omnitrophota bacterium]MCF7894096.1 DUF4115 domain-containing protein [Candidatus Omnitrophota bacterium]
MIEELCRKIKDKRKEAGYSIEEVVKQTKLHPSVIRGIESCNLEGITPIYIKGFIKIYASFLGVEINDELEEIKKKVGSRVKKKEKRQPGQNPAFKFFKFVFKKLAQIPPRVRKNIVAIAVVLIVLWLGFLGIRFSFRKVLTFFRNRPKAEKQKTATAQEKPKKSAQTDIAKPAVGQLDQITASLTVKKDCYIKAISDGKIIFDGVLEKGEVETWKADKELEFTISDGSAVYLEVDGESIPKLSSIHKPIKSLVINSSGITVNK